MSDSEGGESGNDASESSATAAPTLSQLSPHPEVVADAETLSQLSPHPEVVAVAETLAAGTGDPAAPRPAVTLPEDAGERAAPGASYGRFQVQRLLGHGGMGVVLAAKDPELDREVAIKVLRSGLASETLQREAQAMARLSHPNAVTVFEVGRANEQTFIAMELCTGGSLGRWQRKEPRPWREVVARYVMAARGLAAAHELGLVHRDFKPDNVLIGADGTVKVSDFGLVRQGSAEQGAQAIEGTPAYMAPEQLRGEPVDARADQFSFAVAVWEGVFGVRPFQPAGRGDPIANMLRAIQETGAGRRGFATSTTGVPSSVRRVLERALAVDPAQRWPSMTALLEALARTLRPSRRRALIAIAALAVACLAAGALAVFAGRSRPPPADSTDVILAGLRTIAQEARAANDVDTEVDAYLSSYDRAKDPVHLLSATRVLARAGKCRPALQTASAYEVAAKVRAPPTPEVAFELLQLRRKCEVAYLATDDPAELERLANRYFAASDLDGVAATLHRLRTLTGDVALRARYVKRLGDFALSLGDCDAARSAYKTYLDEEPRARPDWTDRLKRDVDTCDAKHPR